MTFSSELDFEKALIDVLCNKGWEKEILKNKTEDELLDNWANILFENNREIDRLGDYPLTKAEMDQIIEQINALKTPLKLNGFINGKTISIKRDNPDDVLHYGKEISLKIYDRQEIAAGQSRYQIAEQPIFKKHHPLAHDRRGDFMLLINGMPLIHVELKKSGVPVSQAYNQIEKYAKEGVYTGLFALVQIFVAMEPNETVYFANPGPDGKFNKDFYFHWADFNNEPINSWDKIASSLLSIPMAHQLIGFYTVADDSDGILKVMRSYQYYAANAISDKVSRTRWADKDIYGGYIWHTTGSGKTMTSFKSAQLIANSKDADKVVFLMDRIELGTQSLLEYRAFADDSDSVQATENTQVLLTKLKSSDANQTLIVTSIQKMSNIEEDAGFNKKDIEIINSKRIVFIIDECHRSTFGEMLETIKMTFPGAIFFGFTGTPIHEENKKKLTTTSDVFGNELHRYSIADGIRDHNVLGFDPYQVNTFSDADIRNAVGLEQAKAKDISEVLADPNKKNVYYHFQDSSKVAMAGHKENGRYIKGIEDYLSDAQYERQELADGTIKKPHQDAVVKNILDNWLVLSQGGKFHAIFATSSIKEACEYYELLREEAKKRSNLADLKLACLFDPSIDNNGGSYDKEVAMIKILEDYNNQYGQTFTLATWQSYKKDVSSRLAHKKPYINIDKLPEKTINILIVVDQMLTGFDSKWINILYLDKVLRFEGIVQAFSRTNRLFGNDKPFGVIKYYRKPYTMTKFIEEAFNLYSGNKPFGIFANKLDLHLNNINNAYEIIKDIFENSRINNYEKLPASDDDKAKFALEFKRICILLEAAKIQSFHWDKLDYSFKHNDGTVTSVTLLFDKNVFDVLMQRYKELFQGGCGGHTPGDVLYDLDSSITTLDAGKIDSAYLNGKFTKYIKKLQMNEDKALVESALGELQKAFASLNQEEQKYANIIIHDIQSGNLSVESGKTFRDYINTYAEKAKEDQIHRFSKAIGVDESKLRAFMKLIVDETNINEFGRFDALVGSTDLVVAKAYFEASEGKAIPQRKVFMKTHDLIRKFVLEGGFEI